MCQLADPPGSNGKLSLPGFVVSFKTVAVNETGIRRFAALHYYVVDMPIIGGHGIVRAEPEAKHQVLTFEARQIDDRANPVLDTAPGVQSPNWAVEAS